MTAQSEKRETYGREEAWLVIDDFMEAYKNCDAPACAAAYIRSQSGRPTALIG
jgi:hypothetical protein